MPDTDASPETAPLIGLSCYREQARWGVWDVETDLLTSTYSRAVELGGGAAALLPAQRSSSAAAVVARLDGLLISGGADVNPGRYQSAPDAHTAWRDDRDEWELALLDAAATRGLPTLGICRGLQVLAVHAGGTLEQHLPDRVGHDRHSPPGGEFTLNPVRTEIGSRLHDLVGPELHASCHHHQAVRTHPGLTVSASADDGTVEGLERPGAGFWLGVQWHPEQVEDLGLFAGLVRAAAAFRG